MPELQIPSRYKPGITKIASLPTTGYEQLLEALKKAPASSTTAKELTAWVVPEVPGLPATEVKSIIETLTALHRTRTSAGVGLDAFVSDIWRAAQKDESKESHIPQEQKEDFLDKLTHLLQQASLDVIGTKAKELQFEFERTFCDARIMTDLRPVFRGVEESPAAMVIVHTLKIGYHTGIDREHHEMYFSLDAEDISKLKMLLDRAEQKARTLKSTLENAGIKSLDI